MLQIIETIILRIHLILIVQHSQDFDFTTYPNLNNKFAAGNLKLNQT
jgi:hypothetical protein